MPHATMPSPGLRALILCGPGVSLNTFTSSPKDFCKALIPIANRPMVWYPLDWCHRMGITDITLITPPESEPILQAALRTHPALTSLPSPKPEVLAPADLTQTTGTGELLRLPEVHDVIESDFVILPCDLVSELNGSRLYQQWITLNPLPASRTKQKGGLAMFYPTFGWEEISNKKDETDFIATVPLANPVVPPPQSSLRGEIEQLVMTMPTDTLRDRVEEDKGVFRIRRQLLQRHGRVKFKTKYRDAHVYIFPKWVKDFVARNDRFDSVSEDVLGWWAKAQWQKGLAERLQMDEVLAPQPASSMDKMNGSVLDEESVDPAVLSSTHVAPPPATDPRPTFASRVRAPVAPAAASQPRPIPSLLAYIQPASPPAPPPPHPSDGGPAPRPLVRRVDTTAALLSVSLYLAKQPASSPLAHEHKIHPTAAIGSQARVSPDDSLVAENVTIGARANLKECVVGAGCAIGSGVRMTRCLLMDGAFVGDGCVLSGCVVGRRARIEGMATPGAEGADGSAAAAGGERNKGKGKGNAGEKDDGGKTKLTDCEVAPNFVVEAGTEAKGEKMMAFDTGDDIEDWDAEEEGEGEDEESG